MQKGKEDISSAGTRGKYTVFVESRDQELLVRVGQAGMSEQEGFTFQC